MTDQRQAARERAAAARRALARLKARRPGVVAPDERLDLAREGAREGYERSARAHEDAAALDESVGKHDEAERHRREAAKDRLSARRLEGQ